MAKTTALPASSHGSNKAAAIQFLYLGHSKRKDFASGLTTWSTAKRRIKMRRFFPEGRAQKAEGEHGANNVPCTRQ